MPQLAVNDFSIYRMRHIQQIAKVTRMMSAGTPFAIFSNAISFAAMRFLWKQKNGEPIIFAEWSFVTGTKVKRRDFQLDQMLEVYCTHNCGHGRF